MSEAPYRLHTPEHARSTGTTNMQQAVTQEATKRAVVFAKAPTVDAAVDAIAALQMYLRGEARTDQ